jgi:transcription elongation factor GreA
VHLGARVRLRDLDNGREREVTLVGSFEADPLQDRISIVSPLGEALLGKSKGDVVEVQTPKGLVRYQIEAVE